MDATADTSCPPRMSDGRSFTIYADRCTVSDVWRGGSPAAPLASNASRQHLIENAEAIMAANRDAAERNNRCGSCFGLNESGTMLPELEMQICNKRTCSFPMSDNMGLGMGRKVSE
jgi:hypothetical protein